MKKANFKITMFGGYNEPTTRENVDGYIVKSDEHGLNGNIILTVHKIYKSWLASEFFTGCRLCQETGNTRKEAIEKAVEAINKNGLKEFYDAIENFKKQYGFANEEKEK